MKALKWIIGIVMVFVFLTGISFVMMGFSADKMHPQSAADLNAVHIKIKSVSLQSGADGSQTIVPQQYSTEFIVAHAPAVHLPDVAALAGQGANVYIGKKDAEAIRSGSLALPPVILAYGVVLDNGTALSDPATVLANAGTGMLRGSAVAMLAIPLLYFIFLFLFRGDGRRLKKPPAP